MRQHNLNAWCPALLAAAGLTLVSCSTTSTSGRAGWQGLFNGENLAGWNPTLADPSVKPEAVWSVREGILICKGEPLGYLASAESYTHFRLEAEYRWAPGQTPGNSGIFGRVNGPSRALPRCLEVQLKHGNAGDVLGLHGMKVSGEAERFKFIANHEVAGDICAVGRSRGAEALPGQWNKVEVLVRGDQVKVWFNGKKVNEAYGAELVPGPVGLQSEGGEIHFRNVRIMRLNY